MHTSINFLKKSLHFKESASFTTSRLSSISQNLKFAGGPQREQVTVEVQLAKTGQLW